MVGSTEGADVVIVGAGVTGMSIAWHLGRVGVRCVVAERGEVGGGMTSVQAGGVRTQWSSRLTCRLALESRAFYEDIDKHLSPTVSPEFAACGCAFIARTEETFATVRDRVKVQQDVGVQARVADAAELRELVPALNNDALLGGSYCPVDGYFGRSPAVVQAFAEAAARYGQRLHRALVADLSPVGEGWRVSLSDGTTLTAPQVVIAAGCDTPDLLSRVDTRIPVRRLPRYLFYTDPFPGPIVRSLVVFQDDALVTKQLANGRFFGADLRYGVNGFHPDADAFETLEHRLREFLALPPRFRFTSVVQGEYDTTPDQQFLTGPVPDRPGLWMAVGFQGRGMMLAPSVGRMMSQAMADGWAAPSTAIPEELLPARFAAGRDTDFEAQVI